MILVNAQKTSCDTLPCVRRCSVDDGTFNHTRETMHHRFVWPAVALVLTIPFVLADIGTGATQELSGPSAGRGHELAHRLCQNCHAIADGVQPQSVAGVPSFPSIANQPGQSSDHIQGILIKPHKPMPDMHLTNAEILDLLAYLDSLRTDNSVPPLIPPAKQGPNSGAAQPS